MKKDLIKIASIVIGMAIVTYALLKVLILIQ